MKVLHVLVEGPTFSRRRFYVFVGGFVGGSMYSSFLSSLGGPIPSRFIQGDAVLVDDGDGRMGDDNIVI